MVAASFPLRKRGSPAQQCRRYVPGSAIAAASSLAVLAPVTGSAAFHSATATKLSDPPPYEALVGNLSGLFSRRLNIQHRFVYQVYPEKIIEDDIEYITPFIRHLHTLCRLLFLVYVTVMSLLHCYHLHSCRLQKGEWREVCMHRYRND